ncbi:MAG: hypothetical protein LBF43_04010 [Puniceicoccales bacterium]|jgi:hypothetical protein|nr:hypothetical protein [Puniceicoccales bacterium]
MSIEGNTLSTIQKQQAVESDIQASLDIRPDNPVVTNLDIPETPLDALNNLPPTLTPQPTAFENRAPGDEILLALQRVSDSQGANTKGIQDTLSQISSENGPITIADTLKLQKLLVDYQLTQDLISKGADKISQGAQALFRNQ